MKKNNYVQQLWADNPVFIVWKKIPLSMKLLFVFCFCFVGLLCANDSYAQRTMISVKAQNLTVKCRPPGIGSYRTEQYIYLIE